MGSGLEAVPFGRIDGDDLCTELHSSTIEGLSGDG